MKNILVVEKNGEMLSNAESLLETLGYRTFAGLHEEKVTLAFLKHTVPDALLIDLQLEGEMDGIHLGEQVRVLFPQLPIVFMGAACEKCLLDRIAAMGHSEFVLKPLREKALEYSLYLALKKKVINNGQPEKKRATLSIRNKGSLVPIPVEHILYLEADGLYTRVHTMDQHYIIRDILKNVSAKLSEHPFVRVHKSFTINTSYIQSFNAKEVVLKNQHSIPLRRGFSKTLQELF